MMVRQAVTVWIETRGSCREFWSPRPKVSPDSPGTTDMSKKHCATLNCPLNLAKGRTREHCTIWHSLQKSLGELAKALESLQQILESKLYMFDVDYPGVYEQVGLIKREMAESETEEGRKKRLLQDSSTMLLMALKSASRLFSKSSGFKVHIGEVWQSFPALLKEVEDSDRNTNEKLKEKAKLFQLIRDHKQSLNLLQKLQTMDQERANDPEYLKLCIEEFVATEQYEQALTFVELLKCTAQSLQLEEQYVLKIYVQAACHFLLQGSPTAQGPLQVCFPRCHGWETVWT